jgi:hypothetical protein
MLPGIESDMNGVKAMTNCSLNFVRLYCIHFCEEATARSGNEVNLTSLNVSITLLHSWNHFHCALFDAKNTTAHDRYMQWYRWNFRGLKCSHSDESYVPSEQCLAMILPCIKPR